MNMARLVLERRALNQDPARNPFALRLSKSCPSSFFNCPEEEGQPFDRLGTDRKRPDLRRAALVALFACSLPGVARAEAVEDLDRLDSRIEVMTGAAPGQPGGAIAPIDRRLKLTACPQPASIEWSGSDALAVRCAAIGWRLRVGIAATARPQGKADLSVHRGDTVEVSVQGDAFDVTTTAIALDDGALGASVRLKIGAAGTQSSAIVTGPGTVSFSR